MGNHTFTKWHCIGCESKQGLRPSATDVKCKTVFASWKKMFVRVWKGRCMLIYIYARILVPVSYLNFGTIYVYIHRPSVRPSRRVRPVVSIPSSPSSSSIRPFVRPVVVVHPLSVPSRCVPYIGRASCWDSVSYCV